MIALELPDEYRAEFSITGPDSTGCNLLDQVYASAHSWFESLPTKSRAVEPVVESGEIEELGYRRFQLDIPHRNVPEFQLRLDIKLATAGGPVSASIESRFHEAGRESPPPALLAGPPSLIRKLFQEFDCYKGADYLSAQPTVVNLNTAREFAANRILNPGRQLPIVAVSQDWQEQPPICPNWLQTVLAGLAEVATYDVDTADELKKQLGFQLACFNGAIRIYQPGSSLGDPRTRHQFWMPAQARAIQRQPSRIQVQTFTRHFPEPDLAQDFDNVRRQVQQKKTAERNEEIIAKPLRQRIQALEREVESLSQQLQEHETQSAPTIAELHDLHRQLQEQDFELESLREQLDQAVHQEAEYEPAIARLHQQQAERDKLIESLRQRLEAAASQAGASESDVAQLHGQLLERDDSIESLRQQIDEAVHREAEVEQVMAGLHAQIQESDSLVESLRQQLDDAAKERGASRQEVEQLEANLQERIGELTELRPRLEDARRRLEESHALVKELTEGLNRRDADIAKLRLLLEGVEDGSADSDKIIAELGRELQEREDDFGIISALLEDALKRADAAENMVFELRHPLAERQEEMADLRNLAQGSPADGPTVTSDLAADNKTIASLPGQIKERTDQIESLRKQLDDALEMSVKYEADIQHLTGRLDEKVAYIHRLEYENDKLRNLGPDELEHYEETPEFNSVDEAVEYAGQSFDRLKILSSAHKSAKNYPFLHPEEVYHALSLSHELAIARSSGSLGMSVEDWMQKRGIDYSPRESEATMQMHREHRRFWDGTEYVEMQEHIKIGSGTADKQHYIRIHLAWREEEAQYLVGHVGEHLPVASN